MKTLHLLLCGLVLVLLSLLVPTFVHPVHGLLADGCQILRVLGLLFLIIGVIRKTREKQSA